MNIETNNVKLETATRIDTIYPVKIKLVVIKLDNYYQTIYPILNKFIEEGRKEGKVDVEYWPDSSSAKFLMGCKYKERVNVYFL